MLIQTPGRHYIFLTILWSQVLFLPSLPLFTQIEKQDQRGCPELPRVISLLCLCLAIQEFAGRVMGDTTYGLSLLDVSSWYFLIQETALCIATVISPCNLTRCLLKLANSSAEGFQGSVTERQYGRNVLPQTFPKALLKPHYNGGC